LTRQKTDHYTGAPRPQAGDRLASGHPAHRAWKQSTGSMPWRRPRCRTTPD